MKLSTRIKTYENKERIPYDEHIVVRLDGHKFSKFTKNLKKPFDSVFAEVMENTAEDLMKEFNAVTAYHQSDEITLILPAKFRMKKTKVEFDMDDIEGVYIEGEGSEKIPVELVNDFIKISNKFIGLALNETTETFIERYPEVKNFTFFKDVPINGQVLGGKTQKLTSLTSAYGTLRFNFHLAEIQNTIEDSSYRGIIKDKINKGYFDSRAFGIKNESEVFNAVLFRMRDAERNSRQMFASSYCSHKELLNKSSAEQVKYCKEVTGYDYDCIEDRYKYGTLFKKEKFLKPIIGCSMNYSQNEFAERTRIVKFSPKLSYSEENVDMIMRKYK